MSLYIGNLSRYTTAEDILPFFRGYGKCIVNVKENYAFVEYNNIKSAKQAKETLNSREILGNVINIKWSLRQRRNQRNIYISNANRNIGISEKMCYICKEFGHIARNCNNYASNNGQEYDIENELILERLRMEKKNKRVRLKSSERYKKILMLNFNMLNPKLS